MLIQIYAFTRIDEAVAAAEMGVDQIGFVAGDYGVVHGELSFADARRLAQALPAGTTRVALTMATQVDEILRMAVAELRQRLPAAILGRGRARRQDSFGLHNRRRWRGRSSCDELLTLPGLLGQVRRIAFSPDRAVTVWEASTGRESFTLYSHTDDVRGRFQPGQRAAGEP